MAFGGNIRNGRTTFPQKRLRRESAQRRQAEYNKLSIDEKINQQLDFHKLDKSIVVEIKENRISGKVNKQLKKLIHQKFAPQVDVKPADVQMGPARLTQEQKDEKKAAHKKAKLEARKNNKKLD